ncbi:MAG: hypothetical protein ACE5EQ_09495, partial [Phycisphaerae bacterium]
MPTPTQNTTTTYVYDGSRQVAIQDHDGNTTTYDYDDAGRLTTITYPDDDGAGAGVVTITYVDIVGRHVRRTDQRSIDTDYFFDDLDRLERREYSGPLTPGRTEDFTFDRSGRLTSAVRNNEFFFPQFGFSRTYDQAGRPLTETQSFGDDNGTLSVDYVTDYAYAIDTAAHEITSTMTTPALRQVTHTLDKLNRLVAAAAGSQVGASWVLDQANRRTNTTLGNGVAGVFVYDVNDRLKHIAHTFTPAGGSPQPLFDVDYDYDAEGNRLFTRN